MPSLANLRSRKNKAVNFTPTKAYWIAGHGTEPNDGSTFTVPPGCIIVVKASPGEYMYDGYSQIFVRLDKEKLKDPLKNSNYLVENFGSIAIFKPGDQCPVFSYNLLLCFPAVPKPGEERFNMCGNLGSGVLNVDTMINTRINNLPIPDDNIFEYAANLYRDSVYPTKQQLEEYFSDFTMDDIPKNDQLKTPVQKFNYIYEELLKEITNINQQSLCTKLGTGVYYNFACRYRGRETDNVYTPNSAILNSHSAHRLSRGLEEIRNSKGNNNLKAKNKALLYNKIAEAETRRKGLLRNYYTSRQKNSTKLPKSIRPDALYEAFTTFDKTDEDILKLIEQIRATDFTPSSTHNSFNYIKSQNDLINYISPSNGTTPLWLAVLWDKLPLIESLLQAGANSSIFLEGKSLFDIASPAGKELLTKYAGKTEQRRRTRRSTRKN